MAKFVELTGAYTCQKRILVNVNLIASLEVVQYGGGDNPLETKVNVLGHDGEITISNSFEEVKALLLYCKHDKYAGFFRRCVISVVY